VRYELRTVVIPLVVFYVQRWDRFVVTDTSKHCAASYVRAEHYIERVNIGYVSVKTAITLIKV